MVACMSSLRDALRANLIQAPAPTPAPGDRLAAVLVLIVERPEPSLFFTERAQGLSRHAGEVSFPGGLQDPQDVDLAATALREAEEEVGIEPQRVELLGALPAVHTFVSAILVTPFVGIVEDLPPLVVSDGEIASVLTVPIAELMAVEEMRELHREGDRVWQGWWYELPEATIWGATGFMLNSLLELLRTEVSWTRA